jgi:hypothetical protein
MGTDVDIPIAPAGELGAPVGDGWSKWSVEYSRWSLYPRSARVGVVDAEVAVDLPGEPVDHGLSKVGLVEECPEQGVVVFVPVGHLPVEERLEVRQDR